MRRVLSNHHIICGYGEQARRLVAELSRRSLPFVAVTADPDELALLRESGSPHVAGDPTNEKVLKDAGLHHAKAVVAAARRDPTNALIVMTARILSPSVHILALSTTEGNRTKLRRAGADQVIWDQSPDSQELVAALLTPHLLDLETHMFRSGETSLRVGTVEVGHGSTCGGGTLAALGAHQPAGVFVLAVRRGGSEVTMLPGSDFVVQDGDELLTVGTPAEIEKAEHRWCPMPNADESA